MAWTNNLMTPDQIKAIKTRVKAEMARRCHMGDISQYASNSYDFTHTPQSGAGTNADITKMIYQEHGTKNTDLLLKINDFKDSANKPLIATGAVTTPIPPP